MGLISRLQASRVRATVTVIVLLALFSGCRESSRVEEVASPLVKPAAPFRVAIVTGDGGQAADFELGVAKLATRYGMAADGGMVLHAITPKGGRADVSAFVEALAADPMVKAVVAAPAIEGTASWFDELREKRPDIVLIAGAPSEANLIIEEAADLVVASDAVGRGYTMVWAARELGAGTIVHLSSEQRITAEEAKAFARSLEAASDELGLTFIGIEVPAAIWRERLEGYRRFIGKVIPELVSEHGTNIAFFCYDDSCLEPLIAGVLDEGGMVLESRAPSPLFGFPEALGVDLGVLGAEYPAVLRALEQAVADRGGAGRLGTWAYGYGFVITAGLGEFARRVVEGAITLTDVDGLLESVAEYSPGARWKGSYHIDADTGVKAGNHLLISTDTYVFGKGYLPTTRQMIPPSYYTLGD